MELLSIENAQHHFTLLFEELSNSKDNAALILSLRQQLEDIFNGFTENEAVNFSNLFARIEYVSNAFQFDKNTLANIHALRIFCNERIHDRTVVKATSIEEIYGQAKTLYSILVLLNEERIKSPELEEFFQKNKAIAPSTKKDFKFKDFVRAYVLEIIEDKKPLYPNRKSIVLRLHSEEDNSIFDLVCIDWEMDASNYNPGNFCAQLAKMAAAIPYTPIAIHNMLEHSPNHFITSIKTTLILDPDFLLDSSDLSACIDRIGTDSLLSFFFRRFLSWTSNTKPMLMGNVVNNLLDNIILGVDLNYDAQLEAIFKKEILSAAILNNEDLEGIKLLAKHQHIPMLEEAYDKFFQNKEVIVEPSFISNKYGLQGRLDALILPSSPQKPYDILELKSSKPNTYLYEEHRRQGLEYRANSEHEAQVAAYKMLIGSVYGVDKAGNGNLLYTGYATNSSEPKLAMINVVLSDQLLQRLCYQRNLVVHSLRQIAEGSLERLFKFIISNQPKMYDKEKQAQFAKLVVHNENKLVLDYYLEFLSFGVREFLCSKVGAYRSLSRDEGGLADLWRLSIAEKQTQYRIVQHLVEPTYDVDSAAVSFAIQVPQKHCFRVGDMVILYGVIDDDPTPFLHQQLYKGVLLEINEHSLKVSIRNKQPNDKFLRKFSVWVMEQDAMDSSHWSMFKSMYGFLTKEESKQHLLLGKQAPEPSENWPDVAVDGLTNHQLLVLNKAINAKDYFLLQGPPGTGKTSAILVNLVKDGLNRGMRCITLLAFTNRAVDEIKAKLLAHNIEFLTLGGQDSTDPTRLSNRLGSNSIDAFREQLKNHRVVVSTVSTYQSRLEYVNTLLPYRDLLIVDEASQLLEPQLAGMLILFKKFVLIGDHIQLPAIVQQASQHHEVKSEVLLRAGFFSLSSSLFERLYNTAERNNWYYCYDTLIDHFRMHESIAAHINKNYHFKLRAYADRQREAFHFYDDLQGISLSTTDAKIIRQLSKSRVQIFDSPPILTAKYHLEEAQWAARMVLAILKAKSSHLTSDLVGVISPWRAQNVKISEELERLLLAEGKLDWLSFVKIDTVERFQGLECEVIIASLAVDTSLRLKGACSLSADGLVDRKFNVAISRAREQFILMGNLNILRQNAHYSEFIASVDSSGIVLRLEDVYASLN